MNKKKISKILQCSLILTLFCFLFFQLRCSSERSQRLRIKEYERLISQGAKWVDSFFMSLNPDSIYLDSALVYLNAAAKCECVERDIILYNKGFVYFHKRDYEKAIETIDSIDTEQFALMESIIIEKIKAKRAESCGNMIERDIHYNNIVEEIDRYLSLNQPVFDSIMRLPDKAAIWKDSRFAGLHYLQIYHRAEIIGADRMNRELDSLQTKKSYNTDYIDEVKEDVEKWESGESNFNFPFN